MTQLAHFLGAGVVLGLSSGVAPGPLLTVTISETLRGGFPAGLRVALVPCLTDGPLILVSWLLLSRFSELDTFLGIISLLGACFLVYMGWGCFGVRAEAGAAEPAARGSLRKGLMTNLLNPAPYLFWTTVGAPLVLDAAAASTAALLGFLAGFFGCIVGAKVVIAAVVVRFRGFLQSRYYTWLMAVMGLALLVFAALFVLQGYRRLVG